MLKLKNVLDIWKKSRTFVVGKPGNHEKGLMTILNIKKCVI
jgi:hypothetical protein